MAIPEASAARRPRALILGGGFGGLAAATALRNSPVDVTLVDRHNYHLFQPLLYQVAGAVLSPGDIAQPLRRILRRSRNVRVLFAEARRIDVEARCVGLDSGQTVGYDYLIVATGATHAYFGHDEWSRHAPGLKTLDDALEIRRRILLAFERAEREGNADRRRQLLTFAVIGGGPTGVELSGMLAGIARHALVQDFRAIDSSAARVLLLEGGDSVLPSFSPKLRDAAARSLAELGVEVRTNALVTAVEDGVVRIGAERIEAGTILWAAGVSASPVGAWLPGEHDKAGRVAVGPTLALAGHPEIQVIGDLALARGDDGKPLPGLASVALQQGTHAARNIRRDLAGKPPAPFRYWDYGSMATIGRNSAVAEFGAVKLSGWIAWVLWVFVHNLRLVGFRNRVMVLMQWVFAYYSSDPGVRLVTGDEEVWSATQVQERQEGCEPP